MTKPSNRIRYLLVYDIADPRRLRRVEKVCRDSGMRVQESVFLCELEPPELRELQRRLAKRIDPIEDSMRFYPLCNRDWHTHREDGVGSTPASASAWIV